MKNARTKARTVNGTNSYTGNVEHSVVGYWCWNLWIGVVVSPILVKGASEYSWLIAKFALISPHLKAHLFTVPEILLGMNNQWSSIPFRSGRWISASAITVFTVGYINLSTHPHFHLYYILLLPGISPTESGVVFRIHLLHPAFVLLDFNCYTNFFL